MDPRIERERKIVIEARRLGKSDDFIKMAIQRDRQNSGTSAPAPVASNRQPIQVSQYQPGKLEKFYGWLEKTAPGRVGTALRGAVTGDGLTREEQKAGIGAGVETAADIIGLAAAPGAGLVKNLATNAAIGATKSAGQALSSGKDIKGVAKSAAVGTGSGAIATGVMKGAAAATKGVLNKGAKVAANQVIRTPVKQTLSGKENLAEGMLKRGMLKTPKKSLETLKKTTEVNIGKQRSLIEANAGKSVNLQDAIKRIEQMKEGKFSTTSKAGLQSVIDDLNRYTGGRTSIDVGEAQALKQAVGDEVGSNAFLADEIGSAARLGKRDLYGGIRQGIEQSVPGIGDVNRELEFARRAGNQLLRQEAQQTGPIGIPQSLLQVLRNIVLNDRILAPAAQGAYNLSQKQMNPLLAAILQRQAGQAAATPFSR